MSTQLTPHMGFLVLVHSEVDMYDNHCEHPVEDRRPGGLALGDCAVAPLHHALDPVHIEPQLAVRVHELAVQLANGELIRGQYGREHS